MVNYVFVDNEPVRTDPNIGERTFTFTFPFTRFHQLFYNLQLPAKEPDELFPPTFKVWINGELKDNTQSNRQDRLLMNAEGPKDYVITVQLETFSSYKTAYVTFYVNNWEEPPPTTYTLTIIASAEGTTIPSAGAYTHNAGDSVTVSATPNQDMRFDHWDLDGIAYTDNPITILMDANHVLTSYFIEETQPPPIDYTPLILIGAATVVAGLIYYYWIR